jgi:enoyl-CoA hydratase/carnithine racemase
MAGASHRVVTERSKIAMPEISIGLYPDVGGSWVLGRMLGKVGVFLALTGAPVGAADALFTGMADYKIDHASKSRVFEALLKQPWTDSMHDNDRLLDGLLRGALAASDHETGPVRENFDLINRLCRFTGLSEIIEAIGANESSLQDPWLKQAAVTLAAGSPSSVALALAAQLRARHLSLAGVFRMELVVSMHCAARPDFAEGIRALLIDKDRRPRWQPSTHAEMSRELIDGYFVSPWRNSEHPLADLGAADRD